MQDKTILTTFEKGCAKYNLLEQPIIQGSTTFLNDAL